MSLRQRAGWIAGQREQRTFADAACLGFRAASRVQVIGQLRAVGQSGPEEVARLRPGERAQRHLPARWCHGRRPGGDQDAPARWWQEPGKVRRLGDAVEHQQPAAPVIGEGARQWPAQDGRRPFVPADDLCGGPGRNPDQQVDLPAGPEVLGQPRGGLCLAGPARAGQCPASRPHRDAPQGRARVMRAGRAGDDADPGPRDVAGAAALPRERAFVELTPCGHGQFLRRDRLAAADRVSGAPVDERLHRRPAHPAGAAGDRGERRPADPVPAAVRVILQAVRLGESRAGVQPPEPLPQHVHRAFIGHGASSSSSRPGEHGR